MPAANMAHPQSGLVAHDYDAHDHWLTRAATRFRLRLVLFVAFTIISAVPVALLGLWVERSAVEKEIAAVSEKHLIIAKNLTSALSRYVRDVESSFSVAIAGATTDHGHGDAASLLRNLNFRSVVVADRDGQILTELLSTNDGRQMPFTDSFADLRERAVAANGRVTFSDLIRDNSGQPAFAVLQAVGDERVAIGVLAPDYLIEVQRSIAFGERGHSMIVDATGHVVAHPNQEWQRTSKDASKLSVVGAMMRGETGVAQFYSPPMQADMIAGHTAVPGVGWGVMVPQPMSELIAAAAGVKRLALAIAIVGVLLAGAISWWLAFFIARPIETEVRERRRAEHEVRSLNDSLEQRVVKRTEELRRTQEELLKKQRLAVMGQTIGTVSHELRNPLAAARNSLFMVEEIAGDAKVDLDRPLQRVERSIKRCEDIIDELLDFSRVRELDCQQIPIDSWLAEVLADQPVPDGITVVRELSSAGVELAFDADRFRRVIINLYDNACQAMSEYDGAQERRLVIRSSCGPNHVEIRFEDTGPGMPADVIERIFEPLFTTKEKGIGLGLPMVKQIIDQHGGSIEFTSTVGEGTSVVIALPTQRKAVAVA